LEILDVADGLVDAGEAGSDSVGQDPPLLGEANAPVVAIEESTPKPPL
tara:strand:+ start:5146 stop:5289 length:144 start_codon:yes stop_codon:yes gene_type:complete